MAPTPDCYALAKSGDPRALVAFGAHGDRTYGELATLTGQLSQALGARIQHGRGERTGRPTTEPRDVLVLCDDRYYFAGALLATWHLGLRAALPHTRARDGIDLVDRASALRVVDRDGAETESESLDVRKLPSTNAPPLDLGSFTIAANAELARVYTSGTTGMPTPFTKTARQLLGEAEVLAAAFEIRETDRFLPTVAAQHIYGLLFGILVPLARGASFSRETPLLPDSILDYAERYAASVLVSVPPQWQALREASPLRLPTLRLGTSSGAPLDLATGKVLRQRLAIPIVEVLGSSETGGIATKPADSAEPFQALPSVDVWGDAEGRLLVRSPFLENSDAPYRSADRIEMVGPNRFVHRGRGDRVVKIGAKRVTLEEIERCALTFEGVREARATTVNVEGLRGTEVWLAVVGKVEGDGGGGGKGIDRQALRQALRRGLDPVFVPRRLIIVRELPRGSTGKISDTAVRALFSQEVGTEGEVADSVTRFTLPGADSRFFAGHFPEKPVFPGAALLCDLILPRVRATYGDLGMLSAVQRLKFRRPLKPSAELSLTLSRRSDPDAHAGSARIAFLLASVVDSDRRNDRDPLCASGIFDFSLRD